MNILTSLKDLLNRMKSNKKKPPHHTPEELACFKQDAIQNHKKHY